MSTLHTLRRHYDLSLGELAQLTGIPLRRLAEYEYEDRPLPLEDQHALVTLFSKEMHSMGSGWESAATHRRTAARATGASVSAGCLRRDGRPERHARPRQHTAPGNGTGDRRDPCCPHTTGANTTHARTNHAAGGNRAACRPHPRPTATAIAHRHTAADKTTRTSQPAPLSSRLDTWRGRRNSVIYRWNSRANQHKWRGRSGSRCQRRRTP